MNRTALLSLAALVLGGALGIGVASLDDQDTIDVAVDVAVTDALAAVTPEPTPEPTPIPTPLIVEVEVAPPECIDAIDWLLADAIPYLDFFVDVFSAYLDYPDENLQQFGQRVETLIAEETDVAPEAETDEMLRQANVCRDAT